MTSALSYEPPRWETLDDIAPELARLREAIQAEDDVKAFSALGDIDKKTEGNIRAAKFYIGDYANTLEREPGKAIMVTLAADLRVSVQRVYEWAAVSAHYPIYVRKRFADLPYHAFLQGERLKDLRLSLKFLEEARRNGYSLDEAKAAIDKRLGVTSQPRKRPTWRGKAVLVKMGEAAMLQVQGELPPVEMPDGEYDIIIKPAKPKKQTSDKPARKGKQKGEQPRLIP